MVIRLMVISALLCGTASLADSTLGLPMPFIDHPPADLSQARVRAHSGSAPQLRLYRLNLVTAVLLYVESVQMAGPVELVSNPGSASEFSSVKTVSSPGWHEWQVSDAAQPELVLSLRAPVADVTFLSLRSGDGVRSVFPTSGKEGVLSAKFYGPTETPASAVFRLDVDGGDPLAPSGCPSGERGVVSGFPYVRTTWSVLGPAPLVQHVEGIPFQTFGQPTFRYGIKELQIRRFMSTWAGPFVPTPTPAVQLWVWAGDGGLRGTTDGGDDLFEYVTAHFGSMGDGGNQPFDVGVSGQGEWMTFDVGDSPLSECHPAVRAGFGGARGRALGRPPGTDYGARYDGCTQSTFGYLDADQDGQGDPLKPTYRCSLETGGLSSNDRDCDDTKATVSAGAPELCDGLDNNCDGIVDNPPRFPRCEKQLGVCANSVSLGCATDGGFAACASAAYGAAYEVEETRCDGLDNDCDGQVDEGPAPRCPLQQGVCADATGVCVDAKVSCPAATYGADFEAFEVSCDGRDNDCDGQVDENPLAPLCATQLGVCAGSRPSLCSMGGWLSCDATAFGAKYESVEVSCDGLDNDCDGQVDEQLTAPLCANQVGACTSSRASCTAGAWVCTAANFGAEWEATESRCDGNDNDCDGTVDEGCPKPAPPAAATGCGCNGSNGVALLWLAACALFRRHPRKSLSMLARG